MGDGVDTRWTKVKFRWSAKTASGRRRGHGRSGMRRACAGREWPVWPCRRTMAARADDTSKRKLPATTLMTGASVPPSGDCQARVVAVADCSGISYYNTRLLLVIQYMYDTHRARDGQRWTVARSS